LGGSTSGGNVSLAGGPRLHVSPVSWSSAGGTAASDHEGSIESSQGAARTRVLLSLAAGVVAFGVAMLFITWQIAALFGWCLAEIPLQYDCKICGNSSTRGEMSAKVEAERV
jgi:hypothetical protein